MRILISSNSPMSNTGYGTQTRGLIGALRRLGHEVSVYAWSGLTAGMLDLGGVTVYPRLEDNVRYGQDAGTVAAYDNADLLITLQDIWILSETFADNLPCPWVPWFPIDGDPVPDDVLKIARTADMPLVMSEFGAACMAAEGYTLGADFDYIPHGIDANVFFPVDATSKLAIRRAMGFPDDAFLISMVAANNSWPSRKSIGESIEAFSYFRHDHPEALLYLHMMRKPKKGSLGVWIDGLAKDLGIPKKAMVFVDQDAYRIGLPDSHVANIYRASDVLLAPSMGEGFGLPIAEAQACGCPVITQDVTSMSELTVNGIAIEPLQRMWTPLGHRQYVASVPRIVAALEAIHGRTDGERQTAALKGARHFRDNYAWPVVTERYWRPFLTRVEKAIEEARDE